MNEKPFKTFNTQMKYLRDKKKIRCEGSKHKEFLIKYGYFNLINAYKEPFIQGKDLNNDHIYIGGITIESFVSLKLFDDDLRIILLQVITRIEEEIRNLVGYKLDFINPKEVEWYDVQAYNSNKDTQDIIRVISKCFHTIDKSTNEYNFHYSKKYGRVPAWIFTKLITFGDLISVVEISKPQLLDALCELYNIKDKRGKNYYSLLLSMLHLIRKVRNSCAHNERVIFFKSKSPRFKQPFKEYILGDRRYFKYNPQQQLVDLLVSLKYFMNSNDYEKLVLQLRSNLINLQNELNITSFDYVRSNMGIRDLNDLEYLATKNKKNINYNKY